MANYKSLINKTIFVGINFRQDNEYRLNWTGGSLYYFIYFRPLQFDILFREDSTLLANF
jgi:hypothetical protein